MPLYYFKCTGPCALEYRKILTVAQSEEKRTCNTCGGLWVRAPRGPTLRVVESLENPFSHKKVERLSEAERLFKERADKANRQDD